MTLLAATQPVPGTLAAAPGASVAASPVRAFPEAEGYGAATPGGRGGRVIEVTNLNDRGPGSLREAVEAAGPRIVVFRTSGTINLQSPLSIESPYITIAGQTAPGQGITLKNSPSGGSYAIRIKDTHDVVIRFLRVRPGPSAEHPERDGISMLGTGTYNVVLDHISASWATDENIDLWYGSHDITVQHSISAEGLYNSTHPDGIHSMGMLVGNDSKNVTVHHNLFVSNNHRNPYFKQGTTGEFINNLVYNWGNAGTRLGSSPIDGYPDGAPTDPAYATRVNIIRNLYIKGPNFQGAKEISFMPTTAAGTSVYIQGNYGPDRQRDADPESSLVSGGKRWVTTSTFAVTPSGVSEDPLSEAQVDSFRNKLLADVGASRGLNADGTWYERRDAVDKRLIAEVQSAGRFAGSEGKFVDAPWAPTERDPSRVGLTAQDYARYGIYDPIMTESGFAGWPRLDPGTPYADSDHDGMPDVWEKLYGLNPNDPGDANGDADGDGYTNVEEFLNGTKPTAQPAAAPEAGRPVPVRYVSILMDLGDLQADMETARRLIGASR